MPVGPISTTGSPGLSSAHRSDEPPISSTMVETRPCSRSTHAPVSARPSIASRVPSARAAAFRNSAAGRTGPGRKRRAASGARTTTSTIVGVSRSTLCTVARSSSFSCAENIASGSAEAGSTSASTRLTTGIALLRRADRFHDVAEVRRVHVAEIAHAAAVVAPREQHAHLVRLGDRFLGPHRVARFVDRLEIFAVEREVRGVFAREHRIGLRAGRDQDGFRRQLDLPASIHLPSSPRVCTSSAQRPRVAVRSSFDASGVRPSAKRCLPRALSALPRG